MCGPRYRPGAWLAGPSIALPALRAGTTATLRTYLIDTDAISVSGVSSGGYMAQQFHVAHAASVLGAGILAAGPYDCAGDRAFYSLWIALNTCMNYVDFTHPSARLVRGFQYQRSTALCHQFLGTGQSCQARADNDHLGVRHKMIAGYSIPLVK